MKKLLLVTSLLFSYINGMEGSLWLDEDLRKALELYQLEKYLEEELKKNELIELETFIEEQSLEKKEREDIDRILKNYEYSLNNVNLQNLSSASVCSFYTQIIYFLKSLLNLSPFYPENLTHLQYHLIAMNNKFNPLELDKYQKTSNPGDYYIIAAKKKELIFLIENLLAKHPQITTILEENMKKAEMYLRDYETIMANLYNELYGKTKKLVPDEIQKQLQQAITILQNLLVLMPKSSLESQKNIKEKLVLLEEKYKNFTALLHIAFKHTNIFNPLLQSVLEKNKLITMISEQ